MKKPRMNLETMTEINTMKSIFKPPWSGCAEFNPRNVWNFAKNPHNYCVEHWALLAVLAAEIIYGVVTKWL